LIWWREEEWRRDGRCDRTAQISSILLHKPLHKSLVTKDRQPYIKTHTKASPEISKSQFIASIPIKGYLITNRVFCIKVNCSEFINTTEINLNEKR
jgi:hypothetical protein